MHLNAYPCHFCAHSGTKAMSDALERRQHGGIQMAG